MSYAIPTNELTLTDIKGFKTAAVEAGISRALSLGLARTRDELIVRSMLPATDFGAAVGWALEQYSAAAVLAAGWASMFNAGAPVYPTLANTKVCVFYKFADYTAAPVLSGVRFRVGGTGATTKAAFMLQLEIGAKLEPDVYFSEPVIYDPQDVAFIEGYWTGPQAVGTELFAFNAFVIERAGANVS
jgi:hypothetical protein